MGPPAWIFLHSITFNYPVKPSKETQIQYKNFFESLQFVIPCHKCQKNYQNKFGEIDFENCKKIAEKDYKDLVKNNCKPNKNDILFSKDGTVGKTSFIDFEENFVVLSSLAIITPDKEYVEPKFLYYTLSSNKFISAAIGGMSGSAIRRIVLKDLKKIKIYIPSIEIQKEKVIKIEEFDNVLKGNRYLIAETQSLIEKKISKLYN